jgi:hypothetical protein
MLTLSTHYAKKFIFQWVFSALQRFHVAGSGAPGTVPHLKKALDLPIMERPTLRLFPFRTDISI